jgi:hypothetical protein
MRRTLPTFIQAPADEGTRATTAWGGVAAIVALSLSLLVQVVLADRRSLAADAHWRPLVVGACALLRCEVPAWREPAAFTLVRRDVRPLPSRPGALHVSARMRNDAVWPQSWPVLVLTLADVDGRAVGTRAFQPREYLGAAPTQATLASGQSADIAMDIVEPAPDVVAFTFDFR